MKRLNIGAGKDIKKDYVNLDSVKLPGINVVHNLNKYPWPFKNNEFDLVLCDNVLEHLDDIIKPMEEIGRITKNHGKVLIKVPIFPSIWAVSDPTHKKFFTYMTFDYFRPEDNLNYYSKARFNIKKKKIVFSRYCKFMNFINLSKFMQKVYYFFFSFLIPAEYLYFELESVKEKNA